MGHSPEVKVNSPRPLPLPEHRLGHHIPRRQLFQLRITRHKALPPGIEEHGPCPSGSFTDQGSIGQDGGVKLHKLQIP